MSSSRDNNNPYLALGVPPPRKTFLDGRGGGRPTPYAHATRPSSSSHPRSNEQIMSSVDTKAVILNEHKTELLDMLQESVAMLKNVYRTKFVFGDHLRFVDPSYGGDAVNTFNLTTPPVFDPSYVSPSVQQGGATGAQDAGATEASSMPIKEKLRTAEELIKKLYRRNTQLELENKYLSSEVMRLERFAGLGKTTSTNLSLADGHLPLDHPLYTKKSRRNCRSCPPTRTLMRSAVEGAGLAFPPRGGIQEEPEAKEDPLPVAQLKKRALQLTEALVAVQHENEKLAKEKLDRVSLRDLLLKNYIVERDTHIAALHQTLQELLAKVTNPLKLSRSKQPALSVNPVVATGNVLKDVSQRLTDQISSLTSELVKKASGAIPSAGDSFADASPTRRPTTADNNNDDPINSRRKELAKRIRSLVETLPVQKRKQLLLLMMELKQLYETLVLSNQSLLNTYESHKAKTNHDLVQLKLEVAMLKDQIRAMGGAPANNKGNFHATNARGRNRGGRGGALTDTDDP